MCSEFKRSVKSSLNYLALLLRDGQFMEWMCDHCRAFFAGVPYRVKSEESGVVLLDMVVCHYCYIEARKLGLRTEGPAVHDSHRE
jgi:hypothetical protein